jgi:hypothetical protein
MGSHPDPLVGVNSAGILAKLGQDDLVDDVVDVLLDRPGVRALYVTAVLARVLGLPWPDPERLADRAAGRPAGSGRMSSLSADQIGELAAELGNTRDGAARWCAAMLLAHAGAAAADPIRSALHRALQLERSRANLRAIGAALSGGSPLTG